jgi:hypothetical protein
VQLKKEKPLTPIVEAFHVPLPNTLNSLTTDTTDHARRDSDLTIKSDLELSARYSSKQTTPSSRFSTRMTEYTTPAYHASTDESQYTAQQIATRDNSAILTFPDTPDGNVVLFIRPFPIRSPDFLISIIMNFLRLNLNFLRSLTFAYHNYYRQYFNNLMRIVFQVSKRKPY